jgi:hypothetical protein
MQDVRDAPGWHWLGWLSGTGLRTSQFSRLARHAWRVGLSSWLVTSRQESPPVGVHLQPYCDPESSAGELLSSTRSPRRIAL